MTAEISRNEVVTIVIPVFNMGRFIRDAVESALSQDYEWIEVIVIDDGSNDGLEYILNQYSSKIRIVRCDRGGPSRARNIGLEEASGKYVQFLDADDILLQGKIRSCVERSRNGVTPFTLKGHVAEGDWEKTLIGLNEGRYPAEVVAAIGEKGDSWVNVSQTRDLAMPLVFPIGTEGPLHRRDILVSCGGFNESLWNCEDVELHFRLANHGTRFECIDEMLVLVRSRASGTRLRDAPGRNQMGIRATQEMIRVYSNQGGAESEIWALLGNRLAHFGAKSVMQGHLTGGFRAVRQAHRLNRFPTPSTRFAANMMFRLLSVVFFIGRQGGPAKDGD